MRFLKSTRSGLSREIQAFQAEVVEYVPALLAVARRLCRNVAEAEDLVQDTVIKAIRARDQFQTGTNLKAWLMKIMRNAFINRYHRAAVERSALSTPLSDPIVDSWMSHASMRSMRDPEAFTLRPQLRKALAESIDRLPEEFKVVVVLADAEGLSYREVAEVLDCPIGTVMSRLHRARKLLKADLIEHARDLGLVQPEQEIAQGNDEPSADKPIVLDDYRASRAVSGKVASRKGGAS